MIGERRLTGFDVDSARVDMDWDEAYSLREDLVHDYRSVIPRVDTFDSYSGDL